MATAPLTQGLRFKGAWSGATAYLVGDIVSLGGLSYACITAHTNHTPPNATYWDGSLFTATSGAAVAGTVTGGPIYWDGSNWVNALLAGTSLSASLALPSATTGTTQTLGDTSAKVATDAFVAAAIAAVNAGVTNGVMQFGPHEYCTTVAPSLAANNIGVGGVNAGRGARVMMAETGFLRDVSCLIQTQSGNVNIVITDTGQANATHTSRTVLAAKGSTACPAAGAWLTYDPDIAVLQGQTMDFLVAADNSTTKVYSINGAAGLGTMPNTNFLKSSGAGTTTQKLGSNPGSIFQRVATDVITDANFTSADPIALFVWRIAQS